MSMQFISSRLNDIIEANSVKYNTLLYEKKASGADIITLSLGEAFFDIPLQSFDTLPFPDIYHYSHPKGILELRQKLSQYFHDEYKVIFDPEKEIIITSGSKIALYMIFLGILNKGDEVIIPEPYWVSYTEQVKLCGGIPITVPINTPVKKIKNYVTKKTKIIVINTPNNPQGKIYTEEELTFLYKLAKKNGIIVLSDEAYSDFIVKKNKFVSYGTIDTTYEHAVICNSISKNYGISGWRLGYMITNENLINQFIKLQQHLITCAPTILEYYIEQNFEKIINITKPQIKQLVKKRNDVAKFMNKLGLTYLAGTATFYLFVSISPSKLDSDSFATKLLEEKNICTIPGIGYGKSCNNYIRISIGTEPINRIKKALTVIEQMIKETSC